jgi:uncharacterized membrane protein YgaE (UPF0421/DUF939 family)
VAQWTAVRSRADQLWARIHALGVRETVAIEREVFRRILKSTVAATLAWLAAELIASPRPALASLAAIIVVQITVRATLTRSIQLTVAVTLGLGAALALGHLLGLHWWSIAIVVLAGLIAGELFRLGTLSAQVAISAMLALSLGNGYGIERVVDTAIGAVIGVVVNALIAPPSHVSEASRTLRGLGEDLGALLADIGSALSKKPPGEETLHRWLTRARDLGSDSRAAIGTVKQGEESLQFNPRARHELAQLSRLTEARRALDHSISQTRGIIRTLLDLPQPIEDPALVTPLAKLGVMITVAARAVSAFGRLQESPSSAVDRELAVASRRTADKLTDDVVLALAPLTASAAAPSSRAGAGRLLSSVLVDAERLLREVDISTGAHRAAVTDKTNDSEDAQE